MARSDLTLFNELPEQLGTEQHNFQSDTIKLGIVDNSTTPTAVQTTPTWADFSAGEVSAAGGYVSGGITLQNVTYTETGGSATLDADDVALLQDETNGFENGYWGILYNDTNSTDMAFAFIDLAGPISEKDSPIEFIWNASGIFRNIIIAT